MNIRISTSAVFAFAGLACAHLGAMVFPLGGETVKAGATVTVKWTIDETHPGGTDIGLSTDGKHWTTVGTVTGKSTNTYGWKVPENPTSTARIRICQKNGVPCTDADNTSKPGGDSPYVLVTGNFTIQGSAAVRPEEARVGAEMRVDARSGNVKVTLALDRAERVTVKAYDAEGKLAAVLMDREVAAGTGEFSLPAKALDLSRPLVFELAAGGRTVTRSWSALP